MHTRDENHSGASNSGQSWQRYVFDFKMMDETVAEALSRAIGWQRQVFDFEPTDNCIKKIAKPIAMNRKQRNKMKT